MDKAHLIAIVNVDPFDPLPERIENVRSSQLSHAPRRNAPLNEAEKRVSDARGSSRFASPDAICFSSPSQMRSAMCPRATMRSLPASFSKNLKITATFMQVFSSAKNSKWRCFGLQAYRFMPAHSLNALPLAEIPGRSRHAAGIIFMILNNLDPVGCARASFGVV